MGMAQMARILGPTRRATTPSRPRSARCQTRSASPVCFLASEYPSMRISLPLPLPLRLSGRDVTFHPSATMPHLRP